MTGAFNPFPSIIRRHLTIPLGFSTRAWPSRHQNSDIQSPDGAEGSTDTASLRRFSGRISALEAAT
jgi:hypothetical protein